MCTSSAFQIERDPRSYNQFGYDRSLFQDAVIDAAQENFIVVLLDELTKGLVSRASSFQSSLSSAISLWVGQYVGTILARAFPWKDVFGQKVSAPDVLSDQDVLLAAETDEAERTELERELRAAACDLRQRKRCLMR